MRSSVSESNIIAGGRRTRSRIDYKALHTGRTAAIVDGKENQMETMTRGIKNLSLKPEKSHKTVTPPKESSERPPLNDAVMLQLRRLLGKEAVNTKRQVEPRKYSTKDYDIPQPIQFFLDMPWEGIVMRSKAHDILTMEIEEFALPPDDIANYPWIRKHSDVLLFGYADVIVACRMRNPNQDISDFDVFVIDDSDEEDIVVEGPFQLSQFLESCEVVQRKL